MKFKTYLNEALFRKDIYLADALKTEGPIKVDGWTSFVEETPVKSIGFSKSGKDYLIYVMAFSRQGVQDVTFQVRDKKSRDTIINKHVNRAPKIRMNVPEYDVELFEKFVAPFLKELEKQMDGMEK